MSEITGKRLSEKEIRDENAVFSAKLSAGDILTDSDRAAPKPAFSGRIGDRIAQGIDWSTAEKIPTSSHALQNDCDVCGGMGVVRANVDKSHPMFGRLVPCPAEDCPGKERNKQVRVENFINKLVVHYAVEDRDEFYPGARMSDYRDPKVRGKKFSLDKKKAAIRAAYTLVRDHRVEFDGIFKNCLTFTGPNGTGKTHLLSAIRNELIEQGHLAWFTKLRSMLKAVQAGYGKDAALKDYQVENMHINVPFLIIDEFNLSYVTDDKRDILENIIDARYSNQKPTIIATNLSIPGGIEKVWGPRTRSRIVGMSWCIELSGAVLRDETHVIRDEDE